MKKLFYVCLLLMITSFNAFAQPTQIDTQPVDFYACSQTAATFSVSASGLNLVYQWYENNVPLTNSPNYSGVYTSTLSINNVTGLNGNAYHVEVTGDIGSPAMSNDAILHEIFYNTWSGAVSTDWSNPMNWSCGAVPIITTNVTIAGSVPNMPLIDIPNAICNDLSIDAFSIIAFGGTNNQIEIHGDITGIGTYDGTNGITMLASSDPQSAPGTAYKHLKIAGGGTKTFSNEVTVLEILDLEHGIIQLGMHDLILQNPASTLSGSSNSFITTSSVGLVIGHIMNNDPVTFHIGTSPGSYTPIMLKNEGVADTFFIRVSEHVYTDGYGLNQTEVTNPVVDRTWYVQENTPGGSLMSMTPMWNDPVDHINSFDPNHVYIAHYMNTQWVGYTTNSQTAPAAVMNGGLLTTNYDSISSFGVFTVASAGNEPLAVNGAITAGGIISVYPNPANNIIQVKVEGNNGIVTIIDAVGRDIKTVRTDGSHSISISIDDIATGLYYIRFDNGDIQQSVRFTKL